MNRDELIEKAVGFISPVRNCYCTAESDTCGECEATAQDVVDHFLPLIEADVRERIATEIEALSYTDRSGLTEHPRDMRTWAASIARRGK